jgi:hypothetical protein
MRGLMLAAVLLVAGTAEAGGYMMIGSGIESCGTWTSVRRSVGDGRPITQASDRAAQEMQWLGFFKWNRIHWTILRLRA